MMKFVTLLATATAVAGQASEDGKPESAHHSGAKLREPRLRPRPTRKQRTWKQHRLNQDRPSVARGAACNSDVDGDGLVNVNDLLSMLGQFGSDGARAEDVTNDETVDVRVDPPSRPLGPARTCG